MLPSPLISSRRQSPRNGIKRRIPPLFQAFVKRCQTRFCWLNVRTLSNRRPTSQRTRGPSSTMRATTNRTARSRRYVDGLRSAISAPLTADDDRCPSGRCSGRAAEPVTADGGPKKRGYRSGAWGWGWGWGWWPDHKLRPFCCSIHHASVIGEAKPHHSAPPQHPSSPLLSSLVRASLFLSLSPYLLGPAFWRHFVPSHLLI